MTITSWVKKLFNLRAVAGVAAAIALVFASVTPVQAAATGKATISAVTSTEGAITVKWTKASSNPPGLYRVKATTNTGQVVYPCQSQAAKKWGQVQSSFSCVFGGAEGVTKYTIAVEGIDKNKRVLSTSSTKTATPIPTKTFTINGSITGSLTKSGTTEGCDMWELKRSTPTVGIPADCQLQVYAITDSGLVFKSIIDPAYPDGTHFTVLVRTTNAKRANVSLELARADGSYIGPVLFTSTGKISLNGQSYANKTKTLPADKTLNLGAFTLNTRSNQTAFMTANAAPAATMLRANLAEMKSPAPGTSNAVAVPVGAGKAGFVQTAKVNKAAWDKVLNYGVTAKIPVTNSIASPTKIAATQRVDLITDENGNVKANIATIAAIDCASFFDSGAKSTLLTCWDALVSYATALGVQQTSLDAFNTACATYKTDPALQPLGSSSYIYSLPLDNTCRMALSMVNGEVNNAIYNNNFNSSMDCGMFTQNQNLALADCYEWLLQQLTNSNPSLIFAFTSACGEYRETRTKGKNNTLITFKLLTTSKADACGLFLRINSDSAGGQQINIQIPPKCKTSFGVINDPAGYLSADCFRALKNIDAVRGNTDIQTVCPANPLQNLPKAQWTNPVSGIGYNAAYNCLMLLEKMGAGYASQQFFDCNQASPGLDSDLDSIPNALDVDDDGDLVIDTADSSGGAQSCNIEPFKSVRTSIDDPLNYGLISAGASKFNSDKGSATYGYLTAEGAYTLDDLNSSINYFLSGENFGIAYYTYKPSFYPNAMVDDQGTLPAVWITCPGVIWCDPATSRATVSTGSGMINGSAVITGATLNANAKTITYQALNNFLVGMKVSISNLQGGDRGVTFNYSNAAITAVAEDHSSFTVAAPENYCRYSDGSSSILDDITKCNFYGQTITPEYTSDLTAQIPQGQTATAIIGNGDRTGYGQIAFGFEVNTPWISKTKYQTWTNLDENKCAAPSEIAYQAALADVAVKQAALDAATKETNEWWDAYHALGVAERLASNNKMGRVFRSPCWSEIANPMVFRGTTDQSGQCSNVSYDPTYATINQIPADAKNFLWQTRCLQADPTTGLMDNIVQGAFISPNINRLAVNTDDDATNDVSAKDALSATDVLTLNYFAADGTIASVATTIGAYPITAPLIRSFNGHEVDYTKVGAGDALDRPLGSINRVGCAALLANNCGPHSVVIDPGKAGEEFLKIEFDRPQREAFPGETSATGYHDVFGLSYGIEFELATHSGCGANFAANKNNGMPIADTAYSDFSSQFKQNISTDSGASYLAPLKDKVEDSPGFEPAAAENRLHFTLDVVKCLRDRAGFLKGKGTDLADLQLPYGARTDGTATMWRSDNSGWGNPNCLSVGLDARGEGKTGGTDGALQQFCLQLAPGALTDWELDENGVAHYTPSKRLGKYLIPNVIPVYQGMKNGAYTASVSLGNLDTYDPACDFSVKLANLTSGGYADVDDSEPYYNQWHFTNLTAAEEYQVEVEVTGCTGIEEVTLKNDKTLNNAKFTVNQGNNGGNNGGGGNVSPAWGNGWKINETSFRAYVYEYEQSQYTDWSFDLVDAADTSSVISGITFSTPQPENGGGSFYYTRIEGLASGVPVQYKLRLKYKIQSAGDFIESYSTTFYWPNVSDGCFQLTNNSCPPPN